MSKAFYSDKEFEQLLYDLSNLTQDIEKINDPFAKETVYNILQHFDAVHREALHRLWQFLRKNHPEIRTKFLSDYSIRHLLALYDLEEYEGIEKAKDAPVFISEDQVKKL